MKKHVSLLLIAFMGISLVLVDAARAPQAHTAYRGSDRLGPGLEQEAQADAQTINQNGEKKPPRTKAPRKRFRRSVLL